MKEKPEQKNIPKDSSPYEDIKFETEEEIEKFISETNKKHIEIKMEIPSAPEEEYEDLEENGIAENLEEEEYSDDKETFEDEENLEHQSYENVNEHNRKMLEGWYARCEKVGLIPKEFTLLPENENAIEDPEIEDEINQEVEDTNEIPETKKESKSKDDIEIDDSVYHNEIKIEDKKSFLEPEIQMKKKKSFHRRRKEEWKRKKSSKQLVVIITEKKEEKKQ